MGMALHNTMAAIEGYIGKKSPFVRTPKFNIESDKEKKEKTKKTNWTKNQYVSNRIKPIVLVELALALFFLTTIILSAIYGVYGMIPFHFLLFVGYAMMTGYAFSHAKMLG